jgi:hypothetical protein
VLFKKKLLTNLQKKQVMKKKENYFVVMLTTNKESDIWESKHGRLHYQEANFNDPDECKNQHLYIISNEEIKEGDWCINTNKDTILQINNITSSTQGLEYWKKIIATTDPSLNLPQLPESFIQAYIKAYNEGNPITEIALEMEEGLHKGEEIDKSYPKEFIEALNTPKTREDNTVIVHQSKTYSREERDNDIIKALQLYDSRVNQTYSVEKLKKWIEENL